MKILPYIVLGAIGMVSSLPLIGTSSGLLLSKSPKIASDQKQNCTKSQKDKYGRCPYTGRSNFRYLSTSGSGSEGRSGSGGGGGK
jgi:hypothetical protein